MTKVISVIMVLVTFALVISSSIGHFFGSIPFDTLIITVIALVIFSVAWLLANRGHWRIASLIPTALLYAIAVYGTLIGGVAAPALIFYAVIIVLVALLQGERYHWSVMVLVLISYSGFYSLEYYGYLHPIRTVESAFVNRLVIANGLFIFMAILLWFFATQHREALNISRENEKKLAERAQELVRINQEYASELSSRIQAENALRESEERFRLLAENSTDMISRQTPDGTCLYVSPSCLRLTGYEPKELIGRYAYEFFNPYDVEIIREYHQKILMNNEPMGVTYRFRCKNGDYVWFETLSHAIRDEKSGEILEIQASSRDVTSRVKTEEALIESERKFRDMADFLPVSVFELDLSGRITFANRMALDSFGYDQTDLEQGIGYTQMIIEEQGDAVRHTFELLIQGRPSFGQQLIAIRKDKTTFPVMINTTLIKRHDVTIGLRGVVVDMTERKEAERMLRESEEKYRQIYENAPFGIFHSTISGKYLDANPSAAKIFGYSSPQELIETVNRKGMAETVYQYPEVRKRIVKEIRYKKGWGMYETQYVRKDGQIITAILQIRLAQSLENGDGVLEGFYEDISERKRAEQEIRNLNASLEMRVAERTVQLEAAIKDLESFSYSVSHDLRQPLRAIDGFSQMLEEEFSPMMNERGERTIKRIRSGVQRMGNLIEDLLNLSRISRTEMRKKHVNMTALAGVISDELRLQYPGRSVETIIQDGVEAYGDERLLRIVMENLLGNAWKFSSKSPDTKVEFGAYAEGDGHPVYFVRDNGVGFDMAYSDKLFGAFQRLHGTTEFPGTGIGLTTVQRIIQRHGGSIWAESEIDKGATFFFTL